MHLDKELLEELKQCEKHISKLVPLKEKSQNNHKQQTAYICSVDEIHTFQLFTRQNQDLPNSFSAGLIRKGAEGWVYLCRYNGKHWPHRNKLTWENIVWFHKHTYNIEYIEAWLGDDAYAEVTNDYNNLKDAISQVCKDFNITNYEKFFEIPNKDMSLFPDL